MFCEQFCSFYFVNTSTGRRLQIQARFQCPSIHNASPLHLFPLNKSKYILCYVPVVIAISHFCFHLDITASEQKKNAFLFLTQE